MLATMVAAVAALTGCASSSSSAGKPTELTDIRASLKVPVAWRLSLGSGRGAFLQPAVLENAVYAAATDGTLARIDPRSGATVWRIAAGADIGAGVGSDGFIVVVVTTRGEVLAFGADGKALWRAQAPSDVIAPPLAGGGVVLVRSTDHRVTAFEADSGKRRWTYQRQTPPLTLRASTEMAFAGESALVGFPGGRLVSLALTNGAARWETVVSEPKGTTEVERLADVMGPVAVSGADACTASFQGRVMCADSANGNLRWSRDLSAGAGVAIGELSVYAVDAASNVAAFARDGGASTWRNAKLARRALTTPLALARAVVVGDLDGHVHFLAVSDGDFIGRIRVDSSAIVARPMAWADGVVIQTLDGTLALLTPER